VLQETVLQKVETASTETASTDNEPPTTGNTEATETQTTPECSKDNPNHGQLIADATCAPAALCD